MTLDITLQRLRKKAIIRILIYGVLGYFMYREPRVLLLSVLFFALMLNWLLKLSEIRKFPSFLEALDGDGVMKSGKLAKQLKTSTYFLSQRVKRLKKLDLLPKDTIFEQKGNFILVGMQTHPISLWMFGGWPVMVEAQAVDNTPVRTADDFADSHPLKCPSCGAESFVPENHTVKCPYCGKGLRWQSH